LNENISSLPFENDETSIGKEVCSLPVEKDLQVLKKGLLAV